tara:strand:- start:851 stop:1945 length:1095 start_codon:yes stop_codon:yes gene_type:complete
MNKKHITTFLLIIVLGFGYAKDKYTVSGIVQNEKGETLKKGSVILINKTDGSEVKEDKISRKGVFKLKKISNGKYQINVDAGGKGSLPVNVMDDDVKDLVIIVKNLEENKDSEPINTELTNQDKPKNIENLNTPLKTKTEEDLLPQLRPFDRVDKLQFEDQFFEYESNLRVLKNQIDSLKSIVTAFEKKQTMPNVSREILDLIKVPEFQYRIELRNGTVVMGDILSETDSSLVLKTQIGQLVLKKEMVVRRNKHEAPEPRVIFLGDPFVNIYPDRHEFSGRVKNVGEKRADFVRVVTSLFTQTTKAAGQDSVFVKGTRIIYDSGVIADTALEPGQTATYSFPVKIKGRRKVQYHTMDIHWNTTD